MIGERLGKWAIYQELGRGGMGQVYLAQEELGGRKAALKVLAADLAKDAGFLERFQREIETLSKLDHPGIVRFYESGYENGLYYFAMEYIDGQSLEKMLAERGTIPWPEVLDMTLKICSALRHVHDNGIIHRDIKPPNILISSTGEIKLTDFGIARIFAARHLTATGGVVGTAEFLSPEQAAGKPVTKRSDLYSLGVLLYLLLTGRTPFRGHSFLDLLHKHRYAQFDRPGRIVDNLPFEVEELVCQLLEKDPDKRPSDCMVFARKVESVRNRLERKSNLTSVSNDAKTVAENRVDNLPLESRPGPATLMGRLVRGELDRQKHAGPVSRFFNQAWVLLTLLILCVGPIVYAFWPASAESLFRHGSAIMEAPDPSLRDMERAWTEYLGPLKARFPNNEHQEKVEEYYQKLLAKREPPPSDAQRFFVRGERLRQEGDLDGAKDAWRSLILVFSHSKSETDKSWVTRAQQGLNDMSKEAARQERWQAVQPALDEAEKLAAAGQRDKAEEIWSAVEKLYTHDDSAQDILKEVAQARARSRQ